MAETPKRGKLSKAKREGDSTTNWWKLPKGSERNSGVIQAVNSIMSVQRGFQTKNLRNGLLYGGSGFLGGGRFSASIIPTSGPLATALNAGGQMGPHYNLINAVANTIIARMLSAGAPRVTFLTSRGDFEQQHKAELLDQFNEGLMYQCGMDHLATKVLLDCIVFGTGILKITSDANNNLLVERTFINELWTEMFDGRDEHPRSLYQVGLQDRDILAAKYPSKAKEILALRSTFPMDQTSNSTLNSNVVATFEGWRLPNPGEEKAGVHTLCLTPDVTLVDEPWDDDKFPFSVIRFNDTLTGYHGQGIGEMLHPHQTALNSITKAEYYAHRQMSVPRLYVDVNAKVNMNKLLTSMHGLVLEGIGPNPPTALNWAATTPDFVALKDWVIKSGYEFVGVSQAASSGVLPAGLDSGTAIRDYMENADIRFTLLSQRFGQFYIDTAKKLIAEAQKIYSKTKEFKVKVKGKRFVEEIDWKKISLDEDEYTLKLYPTSSLPRSPAGRLNTVKDLVQGGFMDVDTGRRLLQFPDLEEENGLANAALEDAEMTAEQLLHGDDFPTPDPLQNLVLCIQKVTEAALRAKNDGAPDDKLERCRQWLVQARALLAPPAPVTAPGQGTPNAVGGPTMGATAPQAAPAKPPVSPLLPNQPQ